MCIRDRFQDYVKKGYVSKVLGYEDKSIEAFLKPTAVGAVFGADSTKVGRNPCLLYTSTYCSRTGQQDIRYP